GAGQADRFVAAAAGGVVVGFVVGDDGQPIGQVRNLSYGGVLVPVDAAAEKRKRAADVLGQAGLWAAADRDADVAAIQHDIVGLQFVARGDVIAAVGVPVGQFLHVQV